MSFIRNLFTVSELHLTSNLLIGLLDCDVITLHKVELLPNLTCVPSSLNLPCRTLV